MDDPSLISQIIGILPEAGLMILTMIFVLELEKRFRANTTEQNKAFVEAIGKLTERVDALTGLIIAHDARSGSGQMSPEVRAAVKSFMPSSDK